MKLSDRQLKVLERYNTGLALDRVSADLRTVCALERRGLLRCVPPHHDEITEAGRKVLRDPNDGDQEPTPRGDAARDVDWWGTPVGHAINRIEELEEWQDRARRVIAASRRQTWRARRERDAAVRFRLECLDRAAEVIDQHYLRATAAEAEVKRLRGELAELRGRRCDGCARYQRNDAQTRQGFDGFCPHHGCQSPDWSCADWTPREVKP